MKRMTDQQRQEIRAEYQRGNVSRPALAARYGVSVTTIDRILVGLRGVRKLWTDLPTGGRPGRRS